MCINIVIHCREIILAEMRTYITQMFENSVLASQYFNYILGELIHLSSNYECKSTQKGAGNLPLVSVGKHHFISTEALLCLKQNGTLIVSHDSIIYTSLNGDITYIPPNS